MREVVNRETHHEKSDVNVRALLWSVVIFVVFAAVTHGLLYAQYLFYRKWFRSSNNPPPLTAVARPADAAVPPEPRLQPFATRNASDMVNPPNTNTPVTDMEQMRAAEDQALHTPGWVDKQRGIVRLPIAVAKQLAVQRLQQQPPKPLGPRQPLPQAAPQPDTGAHP
jgi:hypothetical protein